MPLLINSLITQNTTKMRRGRPLLNLPPSRLKPFLPYFSLVYFCISFNSLLSSLLFFFSLISSFSTSSPPVSSLLLLSLYTVLLLSLSSSILSSAFLNSSPYTSMWLPKYFPRPMAPPEIFYRGGQMGPLNMLGWHTKPKVMTELQEFYCAVVVHELLENICI